jgi:hypothetical protein
VLRWVGRTSCGRSRGWRGGARWSVWARQWCCRDEANHLPLILREAMQLSCTSTTCTVPNSSMCSSLSHPVLRSKPDAHRMYAQDQVLIYTAIMWIQKPMSLLYKLYYKNIVFTKKTILTLSSSSNGNSNPIGNQPEETQAYRINLHRRSPYHLQLLSSVTARVSRLIVATQQMNGKT